MAVPTKPVQPKLSLQLARERLVLSTCTIPEGKRVPVKAALSTNSTSIRTEKVSCRQHQELLELDCNILQEDSQAPGMQSKLAVSLKTKQKTKSKLKPPNAIYGFLLLTAIQSSVPACN